MKDNGKKLNDSELNAVAGGGYDEPNREPTTVIVTPTTQFIINSTPDD